LRPSADTCGVVACISEVMFATVAAATSLLQAITTKF